MMMQKNDSEIRNLRKLLEEFQYDDFKSHLANWLVEGQQQYYVYGNYKEDQAVELVEKVKNMLNLKPAELNTLPDEQIVSLNAGECVTIQDEIDDKTNDNSATISYFQVGQFGKDDYRKSVCLQVLCQYLKEPFFDDLRTKQQLGYVVFSGITKQQDTQGVLFLV